jgi:starch synthase
VDVVVDGETGLLVPFEPGADRDAASPADPARFERDLAAAINTLMADPERRRAMGRAGRRRAETHFSWASVAAQTVDVYRSVAASAPEHARGRSQGARLSGRGTRVPA